jgi:hypothetical protein
VSCCAKGQYSMTRSNCQYSLIPVFISYKINKLMDSIFYLEISRFETHRWQRADRSNPGRSSSSRRNASEPAMEAGRGPMALYLEPRAVLSEGRMQFGRITPINASILRPPRQIATLPTGRATNLCTFQTSRLTVTSPSPISSRSSQQHGHRLLKNLALACQPESRTAKVCRLPVARVRPF